MRFAILGDHRDGLDMACALARRGHALVAYAGPSLGFEFLGRHGLETARLPDIEEVLADPEVDLVIVAAAGAQRGRMLRRAVQSERHVLCVHPVGATPDEAFEAANVHKGTRFLLLPLLAGALHPGVARFAELLHATPPPWVLELECIAQDDFLLNVEAMGSSPSLPEWDVLRRVGGEVVEVVAMARDDELRAGEPLLVNGRFAGGGLFRALFVPGQPEARWRLAVSGPQRLELTFPAGWPGAALLSLVDAAGETRQQEWPAWSPWDALAEDIEKALAAGPASRGAEEQSWTQAAPRLGWLDEIRAIELDDATRRSLRYRRVYAVDLQEASEEANFKGTMTLVGCSMMWIAIAFLFLSIWVPWLGWLIFPALGVFLGLQLLRWVVPGKGRREE